MDARIVDRAMALRVPVVYNGIRYDRVSAHIKRRDERGAKVYSLELADVSGHSVTTAPVEAVEVEDSAYARLAMGDGIVNTKTKG